MSDYGDQWRERKDARRRAISSYCICGRAVMQHWSHCNCGRDNPDYKPRGGKK